MISQSIQLKQGFIDAWVIDRRIIFQFRKVSQLDWISNKYYDKQLS